MPDILIDDVRVPGQKGIPEGVLIARDYFTGIELLKEHQGTVGRLFLDHNLSCCRNGREYTGYDVMLFLERFPEYCPESITFVTDSLVEQQRMQIVWGAIQSGKEEK